MEVILKAELHFIISIKCKTVLQLKIIMQGSSVKDNDSKIIEPFHCSKLSISRKLSFVGGNTSDFIPN